MEKRKTIPVIFILGSARSGTTWLAKLFDSHPGVLYRHEPDSVLINKEIPFLPNSSELDDYLPLTKEYLDSLIKVRHLKSSGHAPFFPKAYRRHSRETIHKTLIYLSKLQERFHLGQSNIPDLIDRKKQHDIIYVIKSVNSLARMRLFSLAMPQTKFIHLIRHPCAVVASRLRGIEDKRMKPNFFLNSLFQLPETSLYPFEKQDIEGRSLEEKFAYQWMVHNDKVSLEMNQASNYASVHYEELCTDTLATLKSLFKFSEMSWNEQTETFINTLNSLESDEKHYFSVLRSPGNSYNTWQTKLNENQIKKTLEIVKHSRSIDLQQLINKWS